MPIIDFVKWETSPQLLAWKFPSQDLATWTQLVVNEAQEAFVVHGGVYDGPFGAGRHTLATENLPGLRGVLGLPFGGRSPFTAEVWFVNRLTNLDVRWGTPDPIQLQDPKFGVMAPVRAFGQYGIRITDSKRFLLKLVGAVPGFDVETLSDYFRGVLITKIKTEIASQIVTRKMSILEVSTELEMLSNSLHASIAAGMNEYGVELAQFNIHSINVPDDDPAVRVLKAALAKRAEMGIIGFNYQQERSFDVMQTAAGNEGTAAGMMGAGLGLGMGVSAMPAFGNALGQMATQIQPQSGSVTPGPTLQVAGTPPPVQGEPPTTAIKALNESAERIRLLREIATMKAEGLLTAEEFDAEKRKILEK